MPSAYHPEAWHELYVTLGGAIAALTGLLFVATSLHVEKIAITPHWGRRAFTNTFALIGVLIECLLVFGAAVPDLAGLRADRIESVSAGVPDGPANPKLGRYRCGIAANAFAFRYHRVAAWCGRRGRAHRSRRRRYASRDRKLHSPDLGLRLERLVVVDCELPGLTLRRTSLADIE